MLLLDSHIYLWFIDEDDKLSPKLKNIIETTDEVYVSVLTFWELTIKSNIGKLDLPCSPSRMMKDCEKIKIQILPIMASHLDVLKDLELIHRDPFDRMIISQAIAEDMTLVTVDENIVKYSGLKILTQ